MNHEKQQQSQISSFSDKSKPQFYLFDVGQHGCIQFFLTMSLNDRWQFPITNKSMKSDNSDYLEILDFDNCVMTK